MGWVVNVTIRPIYPRERPGTRSRSGRLRKISPPPGFDPRTVQPVASIYTDSINGAVWNSKFFEALSFEIWKIPKSSEIQDCDVV